MYKKTGELRCIKGIDTTVIMTLHVEVSDFNRFTGANAFVSFCGHIINRKFKYN